MRIDDEDEWWIKRARENWLEITCYLAASR